MQPPPPPALPKTDNCVNSRLIVLGPWPLGLPASGRCWQGLREPHAGCRPGLAARAVQKQGCTQAGPGWENRCLRNSVDTKGSLSPASPSLGPRVAPLQPAARLGRGWRAGGRGKLVDFAVLGDLFLDWGCGVKAACAGSEGRDLPVNRAAGPLASGRLSFPAGERDWPALLGHWSRKWVATGKSLAASGQEEGLDGRSHGRSHCR